MLSAEDRDVKARRTVSATGAAALLGRSSRVRPDGPPAARVASSWPARRRRAGHVRGLKAFAAWCAAEQVGLLVAAGRGIIGADQDWSQGSCNTTASRSAIG